MRDWIVVVASFVVIFAFSSVDSSISPMVNEVHRYFGVQLQRVLWLISGCTLGIVLGVFVGPSLVSRVRVSRLLSYAAAGLVLSLVAFLSVTDFRVALGARFCFGLSSGCVASCMWWLTFHGVSKRHYPSMVAVLMSARPLATALGVPFAGLVAVHAGWKAPFGFFAGALVLSGAVLGGTLVFSDQAAVVKTTTSAQAGTEETKRGGLWKKLIQGYVDAFRVPYSTSYYLGMTINRMCYFGFYSLSGIWFIRHYGLSLSKISTALFFIGLGEALINFVVPSILRIIGHRFAFVWSLIVSAVLFPLFISGRFPLALAIALITVFMLLDRIYAMAAVVTIPQMFPSAPNKTIFGSLNTLTAWGGLTLVSWFEGQFLSSLGIVGIEVILWICFVIGSGLLYFVQSRTVFPQLSKTAREQES